MAGAESVFNSPLFFIIELTLIYLLSILIILIYYNKRIENILYSKLDKYISQEKKSNINTMLISNKNQINNLIEKLLNNINNNINKLENKLVDVNRSFESLNTNISKINFNLNNNIKELNNILNKINLASNSIENKINLFEENFLRIKEDFDNRVRGLVHELASMNQSMAEKLSVIDNNFINLKNEVINKLNEIDRNILNEITNKMDSFGINLNNINLQFLSNIEKINNILYKYNYINKEYLYNLLKIVKLMAVDYSSTLASLLVRLPENEMRSIAPDLCKIINNRIEILENGGFNPFVFSFVVGMIEGIEQINNRLQNTAECRPVEWKNRLLQLLPENVRANVNPNVDGWFDIAMRTLLEV